MITNTLRHGGLKRNYDACSTTEAAVFVDNKAKFGSLQLPGTFVGYVSTEDCAAVCSAVLLHSITEVEHPNSGETTRRRWTNLLVSMAIPTHVDVLCYIDIRWFACTHAETGNLLQGAAALQKKLMHCGWANVRKKNHRFFLKMRIKIHSHLIQLNAWLSFFKMI